MAVSHSTLSATILTAFQTASAEKDPTKIVNVQKSLADDLATAIVAAILSAQVQFPIPVTTAVVGAVGTGGTTAVGTLL